MKSTLVVVHTHFADKMESSEKKKKNERRRKCARRIRPILHTHRERRKADTHDAVFHANSLTHWRLAYNAMAKICWSVKVLNARGIGKSFFFLSSSDYEIAKSWHSAIGNAIYPTPVVYAAAHSPHWCWWSRFYPLKHFDSRRALMHFNLLRLQYSHYVARPLSVAVAAGLRACVRAHIELCPLNVVWLWSLYLVLYVLCSNSWQHAAVKQLLSKYDTIN